MNYPTLYKLTSTGKLQEWTIEVRAGDPKARGGAELSGRVYHPAPNECAQIITRYGQTDGKIQVAIELITTGKNVGKANATTPLQQAHAEAQAQWEKKKKNKGYVETIDGAKAGERDASVLGGIDPMLAHKYADHAAKINWPAFAQPKLDGHRCIAMIVDGVCTLWSRQRKPITGVPHIVAELERLYPGETVTLDGELYNHDYRDKFEQLTSFIRQVTPKPGHEVVQYWVYDLVSDAPYYERRQLLDNYLMKRGDESPIVRVLTHTVNDDEGMIGLFDFFLRNGYEGLMVRNMDSLYKHGRSYDLQKVKEFQDAEFLITDVVPGKAKMADKGVFVCQTEDGKEFKAKMVGNLDDLCKYLDHKEDYIGRMLTVKFQKWSADGIPVFGVAMRIREDV